MSVVLVNIELDQLQHSCDCVEILRTVTKKIRNKDPNHSSLLIVNHTGCNERFQEFVVHLLP